MKFDYGKTNLRFWCQKVLPLVYDDSLSYYELLCKVIDYLNNVTEDVKNLPEYVKELLSEENLKEILSELLNELREQIARANEEDSLTATADRNQYELVWLNGKLIRMTRDILAGDRYVLDDGTPGVTGNYVFTSLEAEIHRNVKVLSDSIGGLSNLTTQDKTTIVSAINELVSNISAINANIGSLSDLETTDKTSIINAINEVLTTLNTNTTNLGNRINTAFATIGNRSLATRNFLLVGDSYGDEEGEWSYQAQDFLGIPDSRWHIECVSGTGFGAGGFENQITSYDGDKSEITDIIICGGLNDSNNSDINNPYWAGMINYMRSFNTYVKTYYPNAKVHLGYIGNGNDTSEYISTRVYESRQLCKYMYYQTASSLGWNLIPNIEFALCQNMLMIGSDGVHPSAYGNKELGLALAEYIISGYYNSRYVPYNCVGSSSYTGDWTKIKYEIFNDRIHIKSGGMVFDVPENTSYTQLTNNVVATLGMQFNKTLSVLTIAMLQNFDNQSWQMIPVRVIFSNQNLSIQFIDTTAHVAGESATLRFADFDIDFPSEYVA